MGAMHDSHAGKTDSSVQQLQQCHKVCVTVAGTSLTVISSFSEMTHPVCEIMSCHKLLPPYSTIQQMHL